MKYFLLLARSLRLAFAQNEGEVREPFLDSVGGFEGEETAFATCDFMMRNDSVSPILKRY